MTTPKSGITEMSQSQGNKHVTHNDAVRSLEQGARFFVVKDKDLQTPPASPTDGDSYFIPSGSSSPWNSHIGKIAYSSGGGAGSWKYITLQNGDHIFMQDENLVYRRVSAALQLAYAPYVKNNSTTSDPGVNDDNTQGYAQNSVWFNTSSGEVFRAVSVATGAAVWAHTSLSIDELGALAFLDTVGSSEIDDAAVTYAKIQNISATQRLLGRNTAGAGPTEEITPVQARTLLSVREALTANRTYYVDPTNGSNSNDGLSSGAGAFATIQKALDVAVTIDFNGFSVTIQLADDTYTTGGIIPVMTGQAGPANLLIQGNAGTPANVLVNTTGAAFTAASTAICRIQDLKIQATTDGLNVNSSGVIEFTNIDFGACGNRQMVTSGTGSVIRAVGDYTISAGAARHCSAANGSFILVANRTVTITGTPAFSSQFAQGSFGGILSLAGNTYTGSATGQRYNASGNSVISVGGAGATYLPGDVAGATSTGGQYI